MTANGSSGSYLLDTSALLTLIEDEEGAGRVESILRTGQVLITFLAGLETYYVTLRERGEDEAERRLVLIRQLPATWIDRVTDAALRLAGRIKAVHRLSLADAIVAALAIEAGAILVHKDPEFEAIAEQVLQERLPYKSPHT
ncbi:MAG: PIN domain-containing protein [Chloroflexi bacterium]|nr:PIN domain-containing protein [Chloroflexota bacterium]